MCTGSQSPNSHNTPNILPVNTHNCWQVHSSGQKSYLFQILLERSDRQAVIISNLEVSEVGWSFSGSKLESGNENKLDVINWDGDHKPELTDLISVYLWRERVGTVPILYLCVQIDEKLVKRTVSLPGEHLLFLRWPNWEGHHHTYRLSCTHTLWEIGETGVNSANLRV